MILLKNFLIGSIFFVLSSAVLAQTGGINGKVVAENGETISDAHIYLSDTKWAISDEYGAFEITGIPSGNYILKVSRIGFHDKSLEVSIDSESALELEVLLTEKTYKDSPVVVTASRTEKELEDVSVPVTVISKKEIERSGSRRLSDILDEQIGMNVVNDHGTGIQVQGFDPDYTLILVDNQPIIGRTAGTLDLTRLAIGNVQQIEMVKGPSSALWGSDALAGVINIITDKGSKPFSWDINSRYGSNATLDGSSNLSFKTDRLSGRVFTNYLQSDGFDLDEATIAPTIPEYQNFTLSGGINYRMNKSISLGINSRFYKEDQTYANEILEQNGSFLVDGDDTQQDYSISPEVKITIGSRQLFDVTTFLSRFKSESSLNRQESGENYSFSSFDQTLNRLEVKSSTFWTDDHTTIMGAGVSREDLTAEIYADVPFFDSYFTFGQHEWALSEKLSLTSGYRFDIHSEYKSQFSPKFSGLYKPNEIFHLRGSLGGGFKAPDFRQLFLNFTNPVAGYSVFGSSTLAEGLQMLNDNGEISELYINVNEVAEIKAEHSFSYNLGFDIFPGDGLQFKVNAFRNNVQDLIETERIALKTNGQSVFSYFNLSKIYTQGAELELKFTPSFLENLDINVGYQYLDARRQITQTFDDVVDGEVITVSEQNYVSMFNRSKNTWNVKLFYLLSRWDLETSLRLQYRGKYGFADFNSNRLVDENEYAEAHTIVNATVAKMIAKRFKLQVGVNNITNYQNSIYLPSNPGITFYTQLNINIY